MYQVKAQHGYEIQVLQSGDNGKCRVEKSTSSGCSIEFAGTYAECVKWLSDRGISLLQSREATERKAWQWATSNQGYTGTFAEWQEMDADERDEYEKGAAGIPTA